MGFMALAPLAAPFVSGLTGGAKEVGNSSGGPKGNVNFVQPVVTVGSSSLASSLVPEILNEITSQNEAMAPMVAQISTSSLTPSNNPEFYSGNQVSPMSSGSVSGWLWIIVIGFLGVMVVGLALKRGHKIKG